VLHRLVAGSVARKHHVVLRGDDGALCYEECLTRDGFDGPYTIMYHRGRPHAQRPVELGHGWTAATAPEAATAPRALRKRHYPSQRLAVSERAVIDSRVPLLYNGDVVLGVLKPRGADPTYFANGDGDDLYYVHEGGGKLRSLLGDVTFTAGDYLFVPRGLVHRFMLDEVPQYWLSIEALGGVGALRQFRNDVGQLRMDAPYSHRDFRTPEFVGPMDEGIRTVVVKRSDGFHGFSWAQSPLDVVGWDGTIYPWAFPIANFQPRVSSVHLPPTWHGTFAARGALICSFVPRPLDFAPDAIPCPYPHASVDCDEFIFYCKGSFTSRVGVGPGSISHHPAGIPHGPHPGAYEKSIGVKATDELAVMLDTYRPLTPTAAALGIEDPGYHDSFL
jgi:homogentisate 1,2-dioxygenase